jgi:hypothetical protein
MWISSRRQKNNGGMKMRCGRTIFGLGLALLMGLAAQPALAQRHGGGGGAHFGAPGQFRAQRVQQGQGRPAQNHPLNSGAHPNVNRAGNPQNPNRPGGANQGALHPNAHPNANPNAVRPPQNAYGGQANVRPDGRLPGQWTQRLGQMSPEQQQRFLQNNERFRSLPPERQQQIRNNLQKMNSLSPAERDRVQHSYQTWQHMSPEQRQYVQRTLLPKWQQMSPDRKQVVTDRLHTLQGMNPGERQAAMNDPKFMQGLNPDEQSVLRGLDSVRNP